MAGYERRMRACLWALACGDALGRLTEGYWPHRIERVYGGPVRDFAAPLRPHDPLDWREAEVSDDTVMTLLLARSLVQHEGRFDADDFAARITERPIKGWPRWAAFARAREAGDTAAATDSAGPGAAVRSVAIGLID
ncbi:MAG TPA: ADP-ribosylglycohydrolase family protein, partial [Thermaerobacter sp.]